MQKNEIGSLPHTIHRNQLKCIRIRYKAETIKLLEENIGKKHSDIGLGKNFLAMTPKALGPKAKINKWGCIKLKSFYIAKETIKE